MATRVNVLNLTNVEVLKTEMSEHDYGLLIIYLHKKHRLKLIFKLQYIRKLKLKTILK